MSTEKSNHSSKKTNSESNIYSKYFRAALERDDLEITPEKLSYSGFADSERLSEKKKQKLEKLFDKLNNKK